MQVDPCIQKLRNGDVEEAWTLFVDSYRRLLFAVVKRFVDEPDDAMDLFAYICEQLRAGDLARLKRYADDPSPRASLSTWLVVVARNLSIDWIRARDGRRRVNVPDGLSPIGERIYHYLFRQGCSHREAFELVVENEGSHVTPAIYQRELREVHRIAFSPERGSPLRRVALASLVSVDEGHAPPNDVIDADARRLLAEAMRDMDVELRLAVQLFVVEGVSAADIARSLGWANGKTVYNRVYRALANVRKNLESRGIGRDDL